MGMVAPQQRIASAYFVIFGNYGDVSRYAEERGVCRQWVYREADWLRDSLATSQQKIHVLEQRVQELEEQKAALEQRLALSVLVDEEPSFGYFPAAYYYQGRVREGLKSERFAESFRAYVSIRGESKEDRLLPDVRRRANQQ